MLIREESKVDVHENQDNLLDYEEGEGSERAGDLSPINLIDDKNSEGSKSHSQLLELRSMLIQSMGSAKLSGKINTAVEVIHDENLALVVDDEDINVIVVRNQVEQLGLGCDSTIHSTKVEEIVQNRIQKVKSGKAKMYRLLLFDYSMPEIDGI